jgi:dihydroflavonol-4-reductase
MGSQILITGATGFIGRHLTRDLVEKGARVRVLARNRRKAQGLFGDSVEVIPGDLANNAAVARACRGVEVVYHVAGEYRFGLRHRRELWQTNVLGTEAILRAASAAGVGRLVHLSSAGVLARAKRNQTLLDERDFPEASPRFSPYKATKWEAERRVLTWGRRGLPVVIASTTCPIGGGDGGPTPTGRLILDFIEGRFPCYCHTGLNFIGVDDLSRGLQAVAEEGRTGERYLLSDENLWLKDFLDRLAAETGLPAPSICLPRPLVHILGGAGEMWDWLKPHSRSARACLETALQSGRTQFFSNAKAQRELGWRPIVPLQESIRAALAWFDHEPAPAARKPVPASLESHAR